MPTAVPPSRDSHRSPDRSDAQGRCETIDRRRSRTGRFLGLASLALFLALALFGARVHWVEEAGSAERDGYAAQAAALAEHGELPRDPFRPALYPLLAAAVASVSGVTAFTAARWVSNLAAVALPLLAWFLAWRLVAGSGDNQGDGPSSGAAARAAAWLAFLLTAVNPNLWTLGQHATTDMTFAALAAGALAAALAYLDRPGWRPALAAGALLGLATFTRGNGLFLAPALLLAWWLGGRSGATRAETGVSRHAVDCGESPAAEGRTAVADAAAGAGSARRRLAHLAGAATAALACLLPHFALRAAVFGDPFHDENWKNLAFKLHGFPDWSYLDRVPFAGPVEVLTSDPALVVSGFLSELARFLVGGGLAQLFGTPLHALAFVAGAGLAVAAPASRRRALWLLFAGASILAALAATFFTWGRLLLVLLPLGNALLVAPLALAVGRRRLAELTPSWLSQRRLASLAVIAGLALAALLTVKTFAFRLPAFVENHPYATVEALRALEERTAPGTVLAGTSPFLGRYLDRRYLYVPDAFGDEVDDPDLYLARLRRLLTQEEVSYLVVETLDLRDRPPGLVAAASPVEWLRPEAGEAETLRVWSVAAAN